MTISKHRLHYLNQRSYCRFLQLIKFAFFINPEHCKFVNSKKLSSIYPFHVLVIVSAFPGDIKKTNIFLEYIREHFSTADFDSTYDYSYQITNSISILSFIISENDILQGLRSLKYSCASDNDLLLYGVIWKIFIQSLKSGVFALCWRTTFLSPFRKYENRHLVGRHCQV